MAQQLECKHGIYKQTCVLCHELADEVVIREKQEALPMKNWQTSSFMSNSAHNSAFIEQEYDIDNAYDIEPIEIDSDEE
ncbi:MAG: hypothetical protein WCH76_02950 [Candidatus Riflemargulisbacteria bacterium]